MDQLRRGIPQRAQILLSGEQAVPRCCESLSPHLLQAPPKGALYGHYSSQFPAKDLMQSAGRELSFAACFTFIKMPKERFVPKEIFSRAGDEHCWLPWGHPTEPCREDQWVTQAKNP